MTGLVNGALTPSSQIYVRDFGSSQSHLEMDGCIVNIVDTGEGNRPSTTGSKSSAKKKRKKKQL